MKTFNVWIYNVRAKGSTGPWEFAQAVLANDESHALEIAKMRFGLSGQYQIYGGL